MPVNSPPPSDYKWVGNTLSYTLDPNVIGVKIKFQKSGTAVWHTLIDVSNNAPSDCLLSATLGPEGTVVGVTKKTEDPDEWGPPGSELITNQTT